MKYATLLLAFALPAAVVAACSATGGNTPETDGASSSSGAGAGSTATTSSQGGGPATSGATTTGTSTSSGVGGSGAGSGSGGGSTSTSSGGAGGPPSSFDFDGGWLQPDSGNPGAEQGDGGTGVVIGQGANAGSPGLFGGANDAVNKPVIVYPADGVLVPPNMNSLELHFIPGAGQTQFELSLTAPTTSMKIYFGCTPLNGGCVYALDPLFWSQLVPFARGTQPVTYVLRGVNGNNPGAVGKSATRSISFAEQDMTGGVYYWNTNGNVQRYDFGFPAAPPQTFMTPAQAGAIFCVGCHVMTREGDRAVVASDIPAPAPYDVFDVVSKSPVLANGVPLTGSANFFSFSPDGKHLLTSNGVTIQWRYLVTGDVLDSSVVASGTMPDWSPDGQHMVYAKPKVAPPFGFPVPGVDSASLELLHFNGSDWDSPTTLVPFAGQNNYYPAFSPTGDWVVFNRSPGNQESFANAAPDPDAGTVPDGELWVVPAGGGQAIRLDQASDPGASSWPKWAPVLHTYAGGKVLWITVASARPYGLRLSAGERTQLWMFGFDTAKAAQGQDPSLPGFWLPFQDINTGNHIAQWTTKVLRKPCQNLADCDPGEVCKNSNCVPGP